MCNLYVISDNQYFNIGVTSLIPGHACVSLAPEDITTGLKKPSSGLVLIYIKDKKKFREVCLYLASSVCALIFFFNVNPGLEMYKFDTPRFWNARLSVRTLSNIIPELMNYTCDNIIGKMSPARRQRLLMAAKGLDYFNEWVSERTKTSKGLHYYNRTLLQILRIYNVSIHNLSLAEEIALACVTVYKIQIRQRQRLLHQQPENSGMPVGLINRENIPGQMNLKLNT
ncbi:hypothetical protein JTL32_20150 [Enterobacter cloacae]|nr:hypothetical protein [Enterobacter cloacae]